MKQLVLLTALFASMSIFAQSKKVVIAENDSLKKQILALKEEFTGLETKIKGIETNTSNLVANDEKAEYLYSYGVLVGNQIAENNLGEIDYSIFNGGFYAGYNGTQQGSLNNYSQVIREYERKILSEEGRVYLEQNAKKEGVVSLPSGLQYKVITEGTGTSPVATDQVKVHYTGTTIDGKVFDSSVERGTPATFPLNRVIRGWTEGVAIMKPGAKYMFYIPYNLAYGERGSAPNIPPYATLIFEVELLEVVDTSDSHEGHDHSDPNHKH